VVGRGIGRRHWPILNRGCCGKVGAALNFRRWLLVYLATGPSFTRWAILAFYGGAVLVIALVVLTALVVFGIR